MAEKESALMRSSYDHNSYTHNYRGIIGEILNIFNTIIYYVVQYTSIHFWAKYDYSASRFGVGLHVAGGSGGTSVSSLQKGPVTSLLGPSASKSER